MSLSPFHNIKYRTQVGRPSSLKDATFKDFSAGLNVIDSDTALQTNWSKVLKNMHRDTDGGMSLRFGTKFKFDVADTLAGTVLDVVFFAGHFLVITTGGEIAKVDPETYTKTAIWTGAIANALPGTPAGWSASLTTIDTTDFKNELIVLNGIDKPIIIANDLTVTYLQDIPTGSNVYTPIGKFCTTVGNYVVIAGIPGAEDEIYISAAGASGTWPGDPAPNDAVSINIATFAPQVNSNIKGISSFRNFLLVHFAGLTVPVELGNYDGAVHTPRVGDVIPDYGLLSHRFFTPLAQEIVFADERGVYSAKRNLFGSALEANFLSQKITPLYATSTILGEQYSVVTDENTVTLVDENNEALSDTAVAGSITDASFCVYNRLEQRIMFFVRVGFSIKAYVFSFAEGLRKGAWSIFEGMDFVCGCSDSNNKVYFARGTQVFQYGNNVFEDEDYSADEIDGYDSAWATATSYVIGDRVLQNGIVYECIDPHTSGTFATDLAADYWQSFDGYSIEFDWELPWNDANARMLKKRLTHIHFDAKGTALFNAQVFTDNIYQDDIDQYDPALELEFGANNATGVDIRTTADERFWGFPCEFKLFKLRIYGETTGRLKFETITLLYDKGSYFR